MIPSPFRELPWQKGYRHGFICVEEICVSYNRGLLFQIYRDSTAGQRNSSDSILQCKNIFSRHGIPEEVVTDKGLQFDSNALHRFLLEYQFCRIASSTYYPRSNGEAEQAVTTVKDC